MEDKLVTPWQTHLFKQEGAAAGKLVDIDELERMWALSPEPFFCNFEALLLRARCRCIQPFFFPGLPALISAVR